mmetsp:Transcript_129919/g.224470  ORF Transcript_129919/g.224470 Transcript_129919/m.224470 type:complete len:295 (+) Transcript_129919:57-941(+)
MRVLAIVLACLACTGHGRRLLMTKPIPSCQTGLSGRVGAHDPHDSLAPLLHLRGGMSGAGCNSVTQGGATEDFRESNIRRSDTVFGLDDVRGGHVEPPPMIPSRSPAYYDEPPPPPFRTTRSAYYDEDLDSDEDLDDIMGLSADMEPNYGIRRMRPGSAGPVRTSITSFGDREDFRERNTRGAMPRRGYAVRRSIAPLDNTESFLERSTRRAGSGYLRGGYVDDIDAAYGAPRTRRGPAVQVGLGEIEDLRDRNMRRAMTRRGYGYGGQVPRHIEELDETEDFRNGYDGHVRLE